MTTTTENRHIVKLVHSLAEAESLLRQNKAHTLANAARYTDRWLVKQRRLQAKYQEQIDAANQELRGYSQRLGPAGIRCVNRYLHECRAWLRAVPGYSLSDVNCDAVLTLPLHPARGAGDRNGGGVVVNANGAIDKDFAENIARAMTQVAYSREN